jgi:hypothetical protein
VTAPTATLTIGITGHRPNRMHIGVERVTRRLELVLVALRSGSGAATPVAVSALAEGSDRLFAKAALALGYRLDVLLPFTSADYETTFGDVADTATYRDLLARASQRTDLPGSLADSTAAYEAVGRATVDASDIVVAVWDGKPAAGRGGTPEIIAYAIGQRLPVIWIDAARDRLPLLIEPAGGPGWQPVALSGLAARAKPLTRARLMRLAGRTTGSRNT